MNLSLLTMRHLKISAITSVILIVCSVSGGYGETTEFVLAIQEGNEEKIQALFQKHNWQEHRMKCNCNPLHLAARLGKKNIVKVLLQSEIPVDSFGGEWTQTPLIVASKYGRREVSRLLLKAGADVNAVDHRSWTPVMYAVKHGHKTTMELLVENGADLTHHTSNGRNLTMIAAQYGRPKVLKFLIETGSFDLQACDQREASALLHAAQNGNAESMRLLLKKGAWPLDLHVFNENALSYCAMQNKTKNVKMILKFFQRTNKELNGLKKIFRELVLSSRNHHHKMMRLWINSGMIDPDIILRRGRTPPDRRKKGWTALMSEVKKGHDSQVKFLLQKGANPNGTSENYHSTPLTLAVKRDHPQLVKLLLKYDADYNQMNKNYLTAVDHARKKNRDDILRLIEEKIVQEKRVNVEKPDEETRKKLRKLVLRLGEKSYKVRMKAMKNLSDMGQNALYTLIRYRNTNNPEIRARVKGLIRRIKLRIWYEETESGLSD